MRQNFWKRNKQVLKNLKNPYDQILHQL
ncbi:Protein of unknown function [Lactobacillus helveticus CIRM-BIA 101]|nr:Protein of unknown function [Lactobacillus helveticus CIRM-BIA 101]